MHKQCVLTILHFHLISETIFIQKEPQVCYNYVGNQPHIKQRKSFIHSLKQIQLKCNKQFIVDFDGGKLSSDVELLLIKEFLHTLGIESMLKSNFKTNDAALFRIHKDYENLLQMIYQIFGTYYEDNCADELRYDPVLLALLGKETLTSQPTLSRFFNRVDDDTLWQFDNIMQQLR